MSVDSGAPTTLTTTPATPQPGPATVTYSTSTAGLGPGSHQICVKAFGTDVTGGSANVETCVTVKVYDLVLAPATASDELGSDHTHTVTATLSRRQFLSEEESPTELSQFPQKATCAVCRTLFKPLDEAEPSSASSRNQAELERVR